MASRRELDRLGWFLQDNFPVRAVIQQSKDSADFVVDNDNKF